MDLKAFTGQFMDNIGESPSNPIDNIITEPTRFINLYHWLVSYQGEVLTLVVFAAAFTLMIVGLFYMVRERNFGDKFLLIILIVNFVVLSALLYRKYFIYLGIIMPYFSILIALTFKDKIHLEMNKKGILSISILVLWLVLIIGNCMLLDNFLEKTKDYNYMEIKEEVQKYIPPGSIVVGNHNYWIALHDKYNYYGLERFQINTSDMLKDLKAEYILFEDLWADDEATVNFVNQNCTLVAVIPANDTHGFGIIKVFWVKNAN